jgi:phage-related protein
VIGIFICYIDIVLDNMTSTTSTLSAQVSSFNDQITSLSSQLSTVQSQLQTAVATLPSEVSSDVESYLKNTVNTVSQLPSDIGTVNTDILNIPSLVSSTIGGTLNDIYTSVQDIPTTVSNAFTQLGSFLNTTIVAPIGNLFNSITTTITSSFQGFATQVHGVLSGVQNYVESGAQTDTKAMLVGLQDVYGHLTNYISNFFSTSGSFFNTVENEILSVLAYFFSKSGSFFSSLYNTYIQPVINYVKDNVFKPIYDKLKTVYNYMTTFVSYLNTAYKDVATGVSFIAKYWYLFVIGAVAVVGGVVYAALFPDIELLKIAKKVGT